MLARLSKKSNFGIFARFAFINIKYLQVQESRFQGFPTVSAEIHSLDESQEVLISVGSKQFQARPGFGDIILKSTPLSQKDRPRIIWLRQRGGESERSGYENKIGTFREVG